MTNNQQTLDCYARDLPHFSRCLQTAENANEMLDLCESITEKAYLTSWLYEECSVSSIEDFIERTLLKMNLHTNLTDATDILSVLKQYNTEMDYLFQKQFDKLWDRCHHDKTEPFDKDELFAVFNAENTSEAKQRTLQTIKNLSLFETTDEDTAETPVAVNKILLYLFQYRPDETRKAGDKCYRIILDKLYDKNERDRLQICLSSKELTDKFCETLLHERFFSCCRAVWKENVYAGHKPAFVQTEGYQFYDGTDVSAF